MGHVIAGDILARNRRVMGYKHAVYQPLRQDLDNLSMQRTIFFVYYVLAYLWAISSVG